MTPSPRGDESDLQRLLEAVMLGDVKVSLQRPSVCVVNWRGCHIGVNLGRGTVRIGGRRYTAKRDTSNQAVAAICGFVSARLFRDVEGCI